MGKDEKLHRAPGLGLIAPEMKTGFRLPGLARRIRLFSAFPACL
jgi:hypothetical protein